MMTNDRTASDNTYDMVLIRVFDAPVEQVWKAWNKAQVERR